MKNEFKSAKLKSAKQSIHKKLLKKANKHKDSFNADELKDMENMSAQQLQKVMEDTLNRK